MDKFTGLLTKIRLLKDKPLLVRFTLVTDDGEINCIVAREIVAELVMMLPEDKYEVTITGHFNKKKQFVVRTLNVNNLDKFTDDLGL